MLTKPVFRQIGLSNYPSILPEEFQGNIETLCASLGLKIGRKNWQNEARNTSWQIKR